MRTKTVHKMPYLYSPQKTETRDGLEPIAICGMGKPTLQPISFTG